MQRIQLLLSLCLFSLSLSASPVLAAKVKCKVVSVDDSTVVFDCGKKAKRLKPDTSVTVTSKKKDGGGC